MMTIADCPAMRILRLTLGPYQTNAYILICKRTGKSLLVDAPAKASAIVRSLEGTHPECILLTHSHEDHTGALEQVRQQLAVPLACHKADSSKLSTPPEVFLDDGDRITVGDLGVRVYHTPGHTPGSLCFFVRGYLFAGDTIFPGGPGHTPAPADFARILASITEKILTLPGSTVILPGHGEGITVSQARREHAVFASRPHPESLCGDVLWLTS